MVRQTRNKADVLYNGCSHKGTKFAIDRTGKFLRCPYRGLSPLIYLHINPDGRFEVDLEKWIDFEPMAA